MSVNDDSPHSPLNMVSAYLVIFEANKFCPLAEPSDFPVAPDSIINIISTSRPSNLHGIKSPFPHGSTVNIHAYHSVITRMLQSIISYIKT